MIVERATVAAADGGRVLVTAEAKQGCARCEAGVGCGGGVLGKLVKQRRRAVVAGNPNQLALAQGDAVMIGLEDAAVMRGALWLYLVPLLTLFALASLAAAAGLADHWVAAAGGAGLVIGFLAARWRATQRPDDYAPVVIERAPEVCADQAGASLHTNVL